MRNSILSPWPELSLQIVLDVSMVVTFDNLEKTDGYVDIIQTSTGSRVNLFLLPADPGGK